MKEKLVFLGIETSCDETAASVVREKNDGTGEVLSNIVSSQVEEHKQFGGVVPELAARAHVEKIDFIIKKSIKESGLNLKNINGISATAGPGLIVCLTVGLSAGKAIAGSLKKPFIAVNHLEGHALSPKLNTNLEYPYLLLLISGGHTQYLSVENLGNYKRLGTTIDDALGEAFDKTAKIIGIEFPGGPKIEKYAEQGDKNRFDLPKPILNRGGCNLSFAGLKTAILRIQSEIKKIQRNESEQSRTIIIRVGEVTDKKQRYMYTYFDKNAPKKKPEDVWRFGMMLIRFLTVKSNSFRTTPIEDIAHQISKKLRSKVQSSIFSSNKTQKYHDYSFDMIESSLSIICNHLRDIWGEVDKDATYERITQLHLLLTKILATNPDDRPLIESIIVNPVFLHMCLIPCSNYSSVFIKPNPNDNVQQDDTVQHDEKYDYPDLNSKTHRQRKRTKNKSEKRKERLLRRQQRNSQRRLSRRASQRLSYEIKNPRTASEPNMSTEKIKMNRNVISEPKEPADNNNISTSNRWDDIFNEIESSKKI